MGAAVRSSSGRLATSCRARRFVGDWTYARPAKRFIFGESYWYNRYQLTSVNASSYESDPGNGEQVLYVFGQAVVAHARSARKRSSIAMAAGVAACREK